MLCTLLASERPLTETYAYADHVCNIWEERKRQDDHQIAGVYQSLPADKSTTPCNQLQETCWPEAYSCRKKASQEATRVPCADAEGL